MPPNKSNVSREEISRLFCKILNKKTKSELIKIILAPKIEWIVEIFSNKISKNLMECLGTKNKIGEKRVIRAWKNLLFLKSI